MKYCISDAALLDKTTGEQLIRQCTTYVDDTLHACNKEYSKPYDKTEETFKCKKREWDNAEFSGIQIVNYSNGYQIHQNIYISKKRTTKRFDLSRFQIAWRKISKEKHITRFGNRL